MTLPPHAWKYIAHLSSIFGVLPQLSSASFFGPLLVWHFKRQDQEAQTAAYEAMNFQLSMLICAVPFRLLCSILKSHLPSLATGLDGLIYLVFSLGAALSLPLYAVYQISQENIFRYPLNFHLIPPRNEARS